MPRPALLASATSGYKQSHLAHHDDANLADPRLDPEILLPAARELGAGDGHPADAVRVQPHAGRPDADRAGHQHHPFLVDPNVATSRLGNRETLRARVWLALLPAGITLWFVVRVAGMPLSAVLLSDGLSGDARWRWCASYCERQAAEAVVAPDHHRRGLAVLVAAVPQQQPARGPPCEACPGVVQGPRLLPERARAADRPEQRLPDEGLWRDLRAVFPETQGTNSLPRHELAPEVIGPLRVSRVASAPPMG